MAKFMTKQQFMLLKVVWHQHDIQVEIDSLELTLIDPISPTGKNQTMPSYGEVFLAPSGDISLGRFELYFTVTLVTHLISETVQVAETVLQIQILMVE